MDYAKVAEQAQRDSIKTWLRVNYAGGKKCVGRWSDHYFGLSSFDARLASKFAGIGVDHARRQMDKLAESGVLKRIKAAYGPVRYTLPRETCDRLAEQVTKELLAEGREMDRIG